MIIVQNIICVDKSLFTILFNKTVLKHLKCKCNDYLVVFQSNIIAKHFIIAKSDNGYRIKRNPKYKGMYYVDIRFKFDLIDEFDYTECTYFLKRNNTIRIVLKYNDSVVKGKQ